MTRASEVSRSRSGAATLGAMPDTASRPVDTRIRVRRNGGIVTEVRQPDGSWLMTHSATGVRLF